MLTGVQSVSIVPLRPSRLVCVQLEHEAAGGAGLQAAAAQLDRPHDVHTAGTHCVLARGGRGPPSCGADRGVWPEFNHSSAGRCGR